MPIDINRPRTRTLHAITLVPYVADTEIVDVDDPIASPTIRIPVESMHRIVFGEDDTRPRPREGMTVFSDEDTRPHDLSALAAKTRPGVERFERLAREYEARASVLISEGVSPAGAAVLGRLARSRK